MVCLRILKLLRKVLKFSDICVSWRSQKKEKKEKKKKIRSGCQFLSVDNQSF